MQKIIRELSPVLVIAAAVYLCYANSFQAPMLFDDHHNIENNENIHLKELNFQSLYYVAFDNPTPRPVAYLTFALNHYFGGQDVWGYHVVNTVIHLINGVLVFWLVNFIAVRIGLTQMDDERGSSTHDDLSWWVALAAGILFVVHPVQTQSVTYIVQRMATLCTMFYLSGLLAFFFARVANSTKRKIVWSVLCFLSWTLALGSKQMAVTLPLAMLLCEWIMFQKGDRQWLAKGAKLLVAAFVLIGLILFMFKGFDAPKLFTRGYKHRDFTLMERLFTEGRVMIHYVTLVILPLPSRLTLVYDYPVSLSLVAPITTLFSWLCITSSIFFSAIYARRYPMASFSVLWFFLHLAVESTFIPLELVYEHRLYLPMLGACLLISTSIFRFIPKYQVALVAGTVLFLLFGYWTHLRNETWQTGIGVWKDNLSKQPNEPRSWFNLGVEYMAIDDRKSACQAFERTVELEPRLQQAYYWHAILLKDQKEFERALAVCDAGLAIPPEKTRGDSAVGKLLDFRVELLMNFGKAREALELLNAAIKLYPDRPKRYVLRAQCYIALKLPNQAIDDFLKALEYAPDLFHANNNYAWLLATHPDERIANGTQAVEYATKACELTDWKVRQSVVTLAVANARIGEFDTAIRWLETGIEMAAESERPRLAKWLKLFENKQALIEE